MLTIDNTSVVFLSHSGKNKTFTRQLAAGLAAYGVTVWFDEWGVGPGESIPEKIEEGLDRSTHLILVWSRAASTSPWVNRERHAFLHRAIKAGKPVIPILLDATPLPPLLADIKSIATRRVVYALDALVGPGRDERALRQTIVALAARREELLTRGVPPGKSRCTTCGSDNIEEVCGGYNDMSVDVTSCRDCGEILDVCC